MVGDAHEGVDAFREIRRRQARTQDNEHLVVNAEVSTVHASPFFVLAQASGYLGALNTTVQQAGTCGGFESGGPEGTEQLPAESGKHPALDRL
jgi:hypothetical protein